ncbi:MAG TPA: MFS transporter [Candidatus Dormibacteraeota bacterium]|nr:MFS transporter [Candidatus Dormibacteraeota bacterium]
MPVAGAGAVDVRRRRQLVRAVVASTVGSTIEWYDFLLYSSAAPLVFGPLFFPSNHPLTGVLIAFSTQFVGFVARPLGGLIFGHFGDRVGRKSTLVATLLTMGLSSAAIGVLPGDATIGIWAGVLLAGLRILQGIGVGGEWGGGILLCMEWGQSGRRGLITSWPQLGASLGGGILAPGVLVLMSRLFPGEFLTWAWRVPFLFSLVLVLVGLYLRLGVLETPAFVRLLEERRIERAPVLTVLARHPGEVLLSALVVVAEQGPVYLFTSFVLVYGTEHLHLDPGFLLFVVVFGTLAGVVVYPVAGHLSDRGGRKPVYLTGVVLMGLCAYPYYLLLDTRVPALILAAAVMVAVPFAIMFATVGALIAETFTSRLRYSGASIGYNLAAIFAGGPAPLIATYLLATYHRSGPIALYIVICSAVSLVAVLLLPDRSRRDHDAEYDVTATVPERRSRPLV